MQTCVPLTLKTSVTESTYVSAIAESYLYRRRPVDCAMLSANFETMARSEIAKMFKPGGICDFASGSQLTYLTNEEDTSIATATNARFFSGWYGLMSKYNGLNDGFVFFDTSSPPNYDGLGFNLQDTFESDGGLWDVGGIPSCMDTPNTGACGTSIDRTSFVPCIVVDRSIWPSCQSPVSQFIYPRYSASDPTSDSGTFLYPTQLLKNGEPHDEDAGVDLLNEPTTSWWNGSVYNQYTFMIHYCNAFYRTPDYSEGRYMHCANDGFPGISNDALYNVIGTILMSFEFMCIYLKSMCMVFRFMCIYLKSMCMVFRFMCIYFSDSCICSSCSCMLQMLNNGMHSVRPIYHSMCMQALC